MVVEIDAYGRPKLSSRICSNSNEAKMEWDTLAKERGLVFFNSKTIVNDVLLYGSTAQQILDYLRKIMGVLKHHHTTLKMKSANGSGKGASL